MVNAIEVEPFSKLTHSCKPQNHIKCEGSLNIVSISLSKPITLVPQRKYLGKRSEEEASGIRSLKEESKFRDLVKNFIGPGTPQVDILEMRNSCLL